VQVNPRGIPQTTNAAWGQLTGQRLLGHVGRSVYDSAVWRALARLRDVERLDVHAAVLQFLEPDLTVADHHTLPICKQALGYLLFDGALDRECE
jgi:hypothetical protein